MMTCRNSMVVTFPSLPENEAFARVVIAAFAVQLSPTVSEMADVKTAVSEAVTNAIVHGYEHQSGLVTLSATIDHARTITVDVQDHGKGIADINQALEPFYTSHPEQERSGMGFSVMQTCTLNQRPARAPLCACESASIRMTHTRKRGKPPLRKTPGRPARFCRVMRS